MARGSFLLGAAVAAAAVMLVPGLGRSLARAGRPITRAAMATGTTAWEEFRRAGAEAYEHFEDLAAEVRAEMAERAEKARHDDHGAEANAEAGHGPANDPGHGPHPHGPDPAGPPPGEGPEPRPAP